MELKIEDLLPECQNCNGTGNLENPAMKQNQGGFGQRVIFATPIDCNQCNGNGVIVTESGKTLIEFFRLAKSKHLIY